ncbi:MAG: tripartite tricarboxylate transporter TctB family protein [Sporomusaceae bacterium]|nr:tripartite tricarboxylate transporter TctB family protein [Sporomusaceae bacterium]
MKTRVGIGGGVGVLLFALIFFGYSLQYPYKGDLGPGPGFFPLWLSGILIILSLVYIYEAWRGQDSAETMPGSQGRKNILFILITMILYLILLPLAGFIPASILFLFPLLYKSYRWQVSLAIAVGMSLLLYVLFSVLLEIQLPGWGM